MLFGLSELGAAYGQFDISWLDGGEGPEGDKIKFDVMWQTMPLYSTSVPVKKSPAVCCRQIAFG